MKRIIIGVVALSLLIVGCSPGEKPSTTSEKQSVEDQQSHLLAVYPVPYYDTSLERDVVIQLYNIRNDARNTHAVVTTQGTGDVVWDCPSIGYPIPYDVQLTNPLVPLWGANGASNVIEQPEPNGLYSSKSSDATWVLCVDESGEVTPVYTEQKVNTFPFPVEIVDGAITRAGEATVTVNIAEASPAP